jgi:CDP-diacylglycerol---glycerol-3-phosphate 3-phosphatidyltransferase
MNIPTWLTSIRIGMVLVIGILFFYPYDSVGTWVVFGQSLNIVYMVILLVFILASLTDFFDGYLARKLNQVTVLGTFLDSIADKMLTSVAMLALAFPFSWLSDEHMLIPLYLVVIMIVRDLMMDALRTVAMSKGVVLAANRYGKVKTFMQMVMIPLVLLNDAPFAWLNLPSALSMTMLVIYVTTLLSLLSFGIYVVKNRRVL